MMYDLADLRHLPGQHDQKTHGRGRGGSDAPAGGRTLDDPAETIRLVGEASIDGYWVKTVPDSVKGFTDDARAIVKEKVAHDLSTRMATSTEDLLAEHRQANMGMTDMYGQSREPDAAFALQAQPDDTQWGNVLYVGRAPNGDLDVQSGMNVFDYDPDPTSPFRGDGRRADVLAVATDDGVVYGPGGTEWAVAGTPAAERLARESMVADLVDTWASTSNDSKPRALAVQEAAAQEFGLDGYASWDGGAPIIGERTQAMLDAHGAVYRDFLRSQYDATQAWFAEEGVTSVALWRGVRSTAHMPLGEQEVQLRPLSSWSYDQGTARDFAGAGMHDDGVVVRTEVPVSRILSQGTTGVGCLSEGEMVVLGPTVRVDARHPSRWGPDFVYDDPLLAQVAAETSAANAKWNEEHPS